MSCILKVLSLYLHVAEDFKMHYRNISLSCRADEQKHAEDLMRAWLGIERIQEDPSVFALKGTTVALTYTVCRIAW